MNLSLERWARIAGHTLYLRLLLFSQCDLALQPAPPGAHSARVTAFSVLGVACSLYLTGPRQCSGRLAPGLVLDPDGPQSSQDLSPQRPTITYRRVEPAVVEGLAHLLNAS